MNNSSPFVRTRSAAVIDNCAREQPCGSRGAVLSCSATRVIRRRDPHRCAPLLLFTTMSDIIWVFHVSDDAFISRHASFPMTKPETKKNQTQKKKRKQKGHSQPHGFTIAMVLCCFCCFLFSHVHAFSNIHKIEIKPNRLYTPHSV